MFDKMTPNQRLIVAVVLSIIFFIAYTAIFPQKQPVEKAQNDTLTLKGANKNSQQTAQQSIESASGHSISQQDKLQAMASNDIVTVKNKDFILKIDTLGRISSKELLDAKNNDKEDNHAQLIPALGTKPLFIRFLDDNLNQEALKVPYSANISEINLENGTQKVILVQKLSTLSITKELTFYNDGHYDITVSLSKDKRYFIYLGEHSNLTKMMIAVHGAMVYTDDEIATIIGDGDAEGRKTFSGVQLISVFDQYFATLIYGFSKDTNIIVERGNDDNPVVYFEALQTMKLHGYIGPKNYTTLKSIDPVLTHAIEYGWFTFAAKPLFAFLTWLHGIFGNWGWAIIALILTIRAILYPLTYKGMVSMQKMKEISPKIKELQAKYKGDPQRANAAVMDMYKKHGANPLGGCLPMILQIPIFFAVYRVLVNAVELQGAEWILWVNDLSRMDSFYVLPILMGASMFFQQRMTPNNFTDPIQEKVFKYLPVVFTVFFVTFPSGLVLYWFVNNLFSIAQQFMVNQQFKNKKDLEKAIAKKEG